MTTKPRFPVYASHDDVVCFSDGTSLATQPHETTGYPDGRFSKACPACSQHTFYDIKEIQS